MSIDSTGYAQGFEACREAALNLNINLRGFAGQSNAYLSGFEAGCEAMNDAIATLPATAGVEVPFHVLARWLLDNLSLDADHQEDAHKLLSHFTILAKPAQEGQGS